MFVYGGALDTKSSADITYSDTIDSNLYKLNVETWEWSKIGELPLSPGKRLGHCTLGYGKYTMVLYGSQEVSYFDSFYVFHSKNETWSKLGSEKATTEAFVVHRTFPGCAISEGNKIATFGGFTPYLGARGNPSQVVCLLACFGFRCSFLSDVP